MAACGAAVPAVAADNDAIVPDASRQATLDIHKLSGTESTTRADGTALAPEETAKYGKPMGGVVFDVYKVSGIDVSTNEGLKVAEKIHERKVTAADVAAGKISVDGQDYALIKEVQSVTTGGDGSGQGTYGLGVYVVAENLANSTPTIDGTAVGKEKVTPSAPFLVSLPMTNPNGRSEWMYDVNVYPKNQVDEITKSISDGKVGAQNQDGYRVGEKITYSLNSTVLVGDKNGDGTVDGADFGGVYQITDTLDASLSFESETVTLTSAAGSSEVLSKGADYTVTSANSTVTVSMTEQGLGKLAKVSGGSVTTDLVTRVATMPANGIVENQAAFVPNNTWKTSHPEPGIFSNKVTSKYGDIVIHKTNKAGGNLSGAVFKVFRATNGATCDVEALKGDPVATSSPTDAAGLTKLGGLQLSNFYDGAEQANLHSYCLVESTAPDGYTLLAKPVKFDLTAAGSVTDLSAALGDGVDADAEDLTGRNVHITNVKKGELPLTGAQGVALLATISIILAGVGTGLVVSSRKKAKAAEVAAD